MSIPICIFYVLYVERDLYNFILAYNIYKFCRRLTIENLCTYLIFFFAQYFVNILKTCIDYYVFIRKTTYFESNIFLSN